MKVNVGDKFGRWTVLQVGVKNPKSKAKNPPNMAYCRCECGNENYLEYRALYDGRSISCGCLRSEKLVERNKNNSSVKVGNVYGYLEVIEDLGFRIQTRGFRESWYRCRCNNCGNENFETNGNNLQTGMTTSCGCINSRGEKLITQILQQNNINFATQYTFDDLLSDKGYPLRFDFAIFKDNKLDFLIEFDGRQHYESVEYWGGEDYLKYLQQCDKIKNNYAKQNNIKMIRIPYYELDNITINELLGDKYVI